MNEKEQNTLAKLDAREHDQLNTSAIDKINQNIIQSTQLVDDVVSIAEYCKQFPDDSSMKEKMMSLEENFTSVRRVRGDGACFYRAFFVSLMEYYLKNRENFPKLIEKAKSTAKYLKENGYPEFTVEDFEEAFIEGLEKFNEDGYTGERLIEYFNDDNGSNYFFTFVRLLTSVEIQSNELYQFYIPDQTPRDFCRTNVEPVAADADQLQITALVTAIGASVQVVSIDDSHQGVQLINTPDDRDPVIHLLFRPGHYEVIYHK